MTSILLRQFLRTQTRYRSKIVVASYRWSHQIETNAIGSKENIRSTSLKSAQLLTQNTNEKLVTKTHPSDLNKILEQLKSDAITYKRVNYKNFYSFVVNATQNYMSPNEGVFLLSCCTMLPDTSKEDKQQLIDIIWNDGIVKHDQPTKAHIISLLRAYKATGRTMDDFNAFLAQYKCDADVELYEEFLYLTCENGEISDEIVKVLSDIKTRGFPLTENLFNALILGHSKNGSVENCEKVLDTMISVNLRPTSETYMQLVRAYIENGDVVKASSLLNERGDTFSQEQTFAVIRSAAINDCVDLLKRAMQFLPEDALHNTHVVPGLRNICIELIHMDKVEMGYIIVNNLPKIKLKENEHTDSFGVFFINEMVRHNGEWTKIVDIAQRLIDSGRNTRALHCCCEIMLRARSPNSLDCLKVLSQKEQLRPHYFWPLFIHHYHSDGEAGILNVLQEMKNLKVPLDQDTLIHYVLTKLPITMKDTKNGIRILGNKGVSIGLLLTPVLYHLLQQFKIDEALTTLNLHKTKVDSDFLLWPLITNVRNFNSNSSVVAFAELVHIIEARNHNGYCNLAGQILTDIITKNNKTVEASILVSVMEQFYKIGLKIPSSTCDQMLAHVQKYLPIDVRKKATAFVNKMLDKTIETTEIEQAGIVKHPRDMTLDELECHLVELQSKNMNTRGKCI